MQQPPPALQRQRFRVAFGVRLRELRQERGWSQEELAGRAGLHRTFLGGLERGRNSVSVDRLPELAHAFGVEPRDLLPTWRT